MKTKFDTIRIMINIHNGVGNHGSFVKSIADAYIKADFENRVLLDTVMDQIIIKYNLNQEIYRKKS